MYTDKKWNPSQNHPELSRNDKAYAVVCILDMLFRKWAAESIIVTKEDVCDDMQDHPLISDIFKKKKQNQKKVFFKYLEEYCANLSDSKIKKILSSKNFTLDYELMSLQTSICHFPLAHPKTSFENIVKMVCGELFWTTYPDDHKAKKTNASKDLLITTQLLHASTNNINNRFVNDYLAASYFDYPFSMVMQLLFLIRRTWSRPMISLSCHPGTTMSLFDIVLHSHYTFQIITQYKELQHIATLLESKIKDQKKRIGRTSKTFSGNPVKNVSDTDEPIEHAVQKNCLESQNELAQIITTLQDLYKKIQRIYEINNELYSVKNSLESQYVRIKILYMTLEYFHKNMNLPEVLEFLSAYSNTSEYNAPENIPVFHAELSLIALTEYFAISEYTRNFTEQYIRLDAATYDYSKFYFSQENNTKGYENFVHPFLTTTQRDKGILNHYFRDKNKVMFTDEQFTNRILTYGKYVSDNCSKCPYAILYPEHKTNSKKQKSLLSPEICKIGGCDMDCPTHKHSQQLSVPILSHLIDLPLNP